MRPTTRRHDCCTAIKARWHVIFSALVLAATACASAFAQTTPIQTVTGPVAAEQAQLTVPAIPTVEGPITGKIAEIGEG